MPQRENQDVYCGVAKAPKVHLHCHLEGTLERAVGSYMNATRPRREFTERFLRNCYELRDRQAFINLAVRFVESAKRQNVMYGEIFIAPGLWRALHPHLEIKDAILAISTVFSTAKASGVDLKLILGNSRSLGPAVAMDTCALAVSLRCAGVVAVGLGGVETAAGCAAFKAVFDYARDHGLHVVAHAGEHDGAASIRSAIEDIGAERIGHAVQALQDRAVVELLRQRNVPVESCPTSNYATKALHYCAAHPWHVLRAQGVRVLIDVDDPAIFGTSLTDEYFAVARSCGIETLIELINNAIDASFAEEPVKERLRGALRSYRASYEEAAP